MPPLHVNALVHVSHLGTIANKHVVPLLEQYNYNETMHEVREENNADQAARTSILNGIRSASTVLEEALGSHFDNNNATAIL